MDNPKVAVVNAAGVFILYLLQLSTLGLIPAVIALIFGVKGIRQKVLNKRDKIFSIIGLVAGGGYVVFAVVGILLYYLIF